MIPPESHKKWLITEEWTNRKCLTSGTDSSSHSQLMHLICAQYWRPSTGTDRSWLETLGSAWECFRTREYLPGWLKSNDSHPYLSSTFFLHALLSPEVGQNLHHVWWQLTGNSLAAYGPQWLSEEHWQDFLHWPNKNRKKLQETLLNVMNSYFLHKTKLWSAQSDRTIYIIS